MKKYRFRLNRILTRLAAVSAGLIILGETGCTAWIVRTTPFSNPSPVYPGTKMNADLIAHPRKNAASILAVSYGILDFVPSAVLDTFCLPFELARQRHPQRDEAEDGSRRSQSDAKATDQPARP